MQKIRNMEVVVAGLKPLLRRYLEDNNTLFKGIHCTCPNKAHHNNSDNIPSAGFVPGTDDQIWHCFACGASGDIFIAFKYLEERDIAGAAWFEVLKELADRYQIPYELEPLKPEEIAFNNTQTFLQTLTKNANSYLNKNHPKKAWDYIKQRDWVPIVDYFQLGFLPDSNSVKKYVQDSFKEYPEIKNHLSIEGTADDFTNFITERLIYPIRHRYTYIQGFVTRSLIDTDPRPKYIKHFLKTTDKKGIVYNLTKAYKTIYLVESASSVFTLHNQGIKNVASILGADSFNENTYSTLVNNGIERVILCLDSDKAGRTALDRILKITQNKSDIKIIIKDINEEGKDPDDIVREKGIQFFKDIPEISSFKFQLEKFKNATEENQKEVKEAILESIINTTDAVLREKMMKFLTQETGVLKTTWAEEIEKYERNRSLTADVGVGEILKEQVSLLKNIEAFEEQALRCGKLKGFPTGFSKFDSVMDGMQPGLYLILGKWNAGKSAFMGSMLLNCIKNPTSYGIYFSIDDPVRATTIPRFIANLSMIPINNVANPIHRIDKNEILTEEEKTILKQRRTDAIELLKEFSPRLGIKDSTEGYDTDFVEKMIKIYKVIAGDRQLIVFVDFLNMVKLSKFKGNDQTQIETELAGFFKRMAGLYGVPIVCTVEGTKEVSEGHIKEKDIKGSASLPYRADVIMLLSSDFGSPKSSMYFYDDKNEANPIVKVEVAKNKLSGFKNKSIYFKFYSAFSKFEECSEAEQREFSRKG